MSKRIKPRLEFRYYQIPAGEPCLALLGEKWIQSYGRGIDYLHFHNYMEIGYCYGGKGELILGEVSDIFGKGKFSVIPKNYPHTTNSQLGEISSWEYLFIDPERILKEMYGSSAVSNKILRRVNARAHLLEVDKHQEMAGKIQMIIELMRNCEEFYLEEVKGLVRALLLEIARMNRGAEDERIEDHGQKGYILISKAIDYISDHYMDPLKISQLSEKCHMSEAHFRRLFSSYMKMSPVGYINSVRINIACDYMRKTNDSIFDIAHKCGFSTESTFHRNFKKVMGISPGEWRRSPENWERQLLKFNIHAEEGW